MKGRGRGGDKSPCRTRCLWKNNEKNIEYGSKGEGHLARKGQTSVLCSQPFVHDQDENTGYTTLYKHNLTTKTGNPYVVATCNGRNVQRSVINIQMELDAKVG